MYDENSFKNYIFWLQIKKFFLMFVFSVLGAFVGVVISQFLIDVLLIVSGTLKPLIIAISTLVFFGFSIILTAGTGKEVQEGYWKMAVLRKLTVISKKLDALENLDTSSKETKKVVSQVAKEINAEIPKVVTEKEQVPTQKNSENIEKLDQTEEPIKSNEVQTNIPEKNIAKTENNDNPVQTTKRTKIKFYKKS